MNSIEITKFFENLDSAFDSKMHHILRRKFFHGLSNFLSFWLINGDNLSRFPWAS